MDEYQLIMYDFCNNLTINLMKFKSRKCKYIRLNPHFFFCVIPILTQEKDQYVKFVTVPKLPFTNLSWSLKAANSIRSMKISLLSLYAESKMYCFKNKMSENDTYYSLEVHGAYKLSYTQSAFQNTFYFFSGEITTDSIEHIYIYEPHISFLVSVGKMLEKRANTMGNMNNFTRPQYQCSTIILLLMKRYIC